MAYVEIKYSRSAFDSIIERVKRSIYYSVDEKNCLYSMLNQMKSENWLLYLVEIYEEKSFKFPVIDFEKMKRYLISEVYQELIEQLLDKYSNYEEIQYEEIRNWFYGMTYDIKLINIMDQKFREIGVKIRY